MGLPTACEFPAAGGIPQSADVPRGIPMGAVISPLLCNIYLHRLDAALVALGWLVVRYADDFVVLCRTEEELSLIHI